MEYRIETDESLRDELSHLPKGTVVYKNIGGKKRPYLQWKEQGKTKSKYVKQADLAYITQLVDKRHEIEEKLKNNPYTVSEASAVFPGWNHYCCKVIRKESLTAFIRESMALERRDCFEQVTGYLHGPKEDRICALYGLRRCGKTVLMKQAIGEIENYEDEAAYIKLRSSDNMDMLDRDLGLLRSEGVKYIFLDEVTLMEDFIEGASLFSDVFAAVGMKIVMSGTDSLGFWLASANELYDRVRMIHMGYIPYREHRRLLGRTDVDDYIRRGGSLQAGSPLKEKGKMLSDSSFRDKESTRIYLDTAIAKNIQHSLVHFKDGYYRGLYPLYEAGELTDAIQRVVEDSSHWFILSVFAKAFKSSDFGSANQILRKEEEQNPLQFADREKVMKRLMQLLSITNDHSVKVEDYQVGQIKEYLEALEVFTSVPVCWLGEQSRERREILCIPGMRYAQCEALTEALSEDFIFEQLSENQRRHVFDVIHEDVLGRILEEVVLRYALEKYKDDEVGTLRFSDGEIDMYIWHRKEAVCDLYEVKHSKAEDPLQRRHLENEEKLKKTARYFGSVGRRIVLYRGERKTLENGIEYIPVEDFLMDFC